MRLLESNHYNATSLTWPDISLAQGVITFNISAHDEEGLDQFTGQIGSVTPQKSFLTIIGSTCTTAHVLTSHHRLAHLNPSNNHHTGCCIIIIYIQMTCDKMSTRGQYYVYCQLLPQDFCRATELFWPVNCTRPSSEKVLIPKAIMPYAEERSGHARLTLLPQMT